ncbi:hypothetical protein [Kytococcus sp. Marseille-QA3725]
MSISRRHVVKGAAWSAPAIATIAAAPALAASTACQPTVMSGFNANPVLTSTGTGSTTMSDGSQVSTKLVGNTYIR